MLAGHRREITAMFCDLRNFTTFSETAEPEEVLGFLRRYHATVGALVVEHEGTLEHFAGDGIMVFFNDPELQDDHAARAVRHGGRDPRAVRRDQRGVAAARPRPRRSGSGSRPATRRWAGSGSRAATTTAAIGNAIILASRLSSEATAGEILIAQRTFAAVDGAVGAEPAGERQLKGFSRPMPVYARADRGRSTAAAVPAAEVVLSDGARDRRGDVRQPARDDRRRPGVRRRARRHVPRGGRPARRARSASRPRPARPTTWSGRPTR